MGLFNRSRSAAATSHDGTHDCAKHAYLAAIETVYETTKHGPDAISTRDRKCGKCGRVLGTVFVS